MHKQLSTAALLFLVACGSKSQPTPKPNTPPQPPTLSAKEPAKLPETKPASASAPVSPPSDLILSLVEPNGTKCEWKKVDPIAKQIKVIASFEGECRGAVLAFSPDKTRALVWFDPEASSPSYGEETMIPPFVKEERYVANLTSRIFEVDINTGKVTTLPLPIRGKVGDVRYNTKNEAFAFSEEEAKATEGKNPTIEFEGKQLPVEGSEGYPFLVHAFKLNVGKWEAVETKGSTTGADYAMGLNALDTYDRLPQNTSAILTPQPPDDNTAEGAMLERLKAYDPVIASLDGAWRQRDGSSVWYWMINSEFVYATGKIVFDDGATFIRPQGLSFTEVDIVSLLSQGDYLLVARASTGRSPRVYDLKSQKLLFSADTARAAVFWPK
jgi:hypothetical protein